MSGLKEIKTSRGTVCGAKHYPLSIKNDNKYDILLQTLTISEDQDTYVCMCLNLHVDGDGCSPEEAEKNMKRNVREFIDVCFNRPPDDAWRYISELHRIDETTREYWNAFFEVFNAGLTGKVEG